MKNVIIVAAACLLTAGITLAATAIGINFKESKIGATDQTFNSLLAPLLTAPDPQAGSVYVKDIEENDTTHKKVDGVIIPGFVKAVFKAGSINQDIPLYNPKENNCYFIISILLSDNTEIYQSDLLAPGETLTNIRLTSVPDPGIYEETILRYTCFDMVTLKSINGANIKFILEVMK